jgi:hypothetical protein
MRGENSAFAFFWVGAQISGPHEQERHSVLWTLPSSSSEQPAVFSGASPHAA